MRVPGSKSITNRALICAALAKGTSELLNASASDDTALLVNALNLLGVFAKQAGDVMVVDGQGGRLSAPKFSIPVGNAGTTFRFLVSVAALAEGTTRFALSPRMAERPLDDLVGALQHLGVRVERDISGLIVSVHGGGILGGTTTLRGDRSSQFLSSLLLTAPLARGDVSIGIDGRLASAPYVQMTLAVLHAFGAAIAVPNGDLRRMDVQGRQSYQPTKFAVESDASGASYAFGAAAIVGGEMTVDGLPSDSLQGDAEFPQVLSHMGCLVTKGPSSVTAARTGALHGIDVDMNAMPDVVPTLVAVALFADQPTRIRNVGHLRFKESNRLETLAEELRALGARIDVDEDGLLVSPAPLHGATLRSHDDHRLAMIFGIIGLRVPEIVIEGAECVTKSYPSYWEELSSVTKVDRADAAA